MQDDPLSDEDALQLLEELQLNRTERIRDERPDQGVQHVSAIAVRQANQSVREEVTLPGRTLLVAPAELTLMVRRPLQVGDLYHLTFDREKLDAEPRIGRCKSCREAGERFEVQVHLYEPVDLKTALVG